MLVFLKRFLSSSSVPLPWTCIPGVSCPLHGGRHRAPSQRAGWLCLPSPPAPAPRTCPPTAAKLVFLKYTCEAHPQPPCSGTSAGSTGPSRVCQALRARRPYSPRGLSPPLHIKSVSSCLCHLPDLPASHKKGPLTRSCNSSVSWVSTQGKIQPFFCQQTILKSHSFPDEVFPQSPISHWLLLFSNSYLIESGTILGLHTHLPLKDIKLIK